jgi:DNA-binding MarR family transcriptional regulator
MSTSAEPQAAVPAVADLSHEVVRLTRSSSVLKAQVASREPYGVDWSAYPLLFELVQDGPKRTSALAQTGCVNPSTISRQVAHLVSLGMVERQADPVDGRAALLLATDAGRNACEAMRERRLRSFALLVADWPVEDVAQLATLLGRLNDSHAAHRQHMLDIITGENP